MAVVTLTDLPKSVRNRCVIGKFGGVLCDSFLFFIFCAVEELGRGLACIENPISALAYGTTNITFLSNAFRYCDMLAMLL